MNLIAFQYKLFNLLHTNNFPFLWINSKLRVRFELNFICILDFIILPNEGIHVCIDPSLINDNIIAFLQKLELFLLQNSIELLKTTIHRFLQTLNYTSFHSNSDILHTVRQQITLNRIFHQIVTTF